MHRADLGSLSLGGRRLFWLWLSASLVLAALLAGGLYYGYQAQRQELSLQLRENTRSLQLLTRYYLSDLDHMLEDLVAGLPDAAHAAPQSLRSLMLHRRRANPHLMDLLLLDPEGRIRVWTGDGRPPDVRMRDYYRHHLAPDAAPVHLGEPRSSLVHVGEWFFSLSRARRDEQGRLLGVAVAILRLDTLSDLFQSLELSPGNAVLLMHQQGGILMRYPEVDFLPGQKPRLPAGLELPLHQTWNGAAARGLDGKPRYAHARPVSPYELIIVGSVDLDQALDPWRSAGLWAAALWLLLSLSSGALLWRQGRQRADFRRQLNELSHALPGFVYQLEYRPDEGFVYRYASEGVQAMFGVSREAVLADAEVLLGRIHPEDRGWVLEESLRTARELQPWHAEFRMQRANGELMWVEVRDTPAHLGGGALLWSGYANDITPRRSLQTALASSERRFRALVESANDIIYTLSRDGHFTYVSPNWQRVLGHDPHHVQGSSITEFVHPDDLPACEAFLRALFEQGAPQAGIEYRVRHLDGAWRWHTSNAAPLRDEQDEVVEYLGIARDITRRREQEDALRHRALHDPLTALPNRAAFHERAERLLSAARAAGERAALMFLDLDAFKPINDTHGHAVGDELLRQLANRLRAAVRDSDVPGRIGGDEFVLLLSRVSSEEAAVAVAEQIRLRLIEPYELGGRVHRVGCSIGIAVFPGHGEDLDTLAVHADQAMYAAKHAGRDRVVLYNSAPAHARERGA